MYPAFGIFLTPVFYYVIEWLNDLRGTATAEDDAAEVAVLANGGIH